MSYSSSTNTVPFSSSAPFNPFWQKQVFEPPRNHEPANPHSHGYPPLFYSQLPTLQLPPQPQHVATFPPPLRGFQAPSPIYLPPPQFTPSPFLGDPFAPSFHSPPFEYAPPTVSSTPLAYAPGQSRQGSGLTRETGQLRCTRARRSLSKPNHHSLERYPSHAQEPARKVRVFPSFVIGVATLADSALSPDQTANVYVSSTLLHSSLRRLMKAATSRSAFFRRTPRTPTCPCSARASPQSSVSARSLTRS